MQSQRSRLNDVRLNVMSSRSPRGGGGYQTSCKVFEDSVSGVFCRSAAPGSPRLLRGLDQRSVDFSLGGGKVRPLRQAKLTLSEFQLTDRCAQPTRFTVAFENSTATCFVYCLRRRVCTLALIGWLVGVLSCLARLICQSEARGQSNAETLAQIRLSRKHGHRSPCPAK